MTIPTHIIAGLIVGELTGNYPAALAGALFVDLDHVFSYTRSGILKQPKKLISSLLSSLDPWGDQRNILHNVIVWATMSGLVFLFNSQIGLSFGAGYLGHLLLDALDDSVYFPFYPLKRLALRGPIGYASKQETVFTVFLAILFGTFWFFS